MSEPTIIENLLDEEELSINQRREKWARFRDRLLPIVRDMQKLEASITFPSSLDISLSGDRHKLSAAVRALRTRGYAYSSAAPVKGASSWASFFNSDECGVQIWFHFSSTVCRRVKVGTKTVEQEVYETVCDELVLPQEQAA